MSKLHSNNWFKKAPGSLPRYEVHLSDIAYSPHRHESYTIALTIKGVQTFQYRGEKYSSIPGQVIVLHPDEIHDGQAGTDEGFTYRSLHLQPELMQTACGQSSLPFLEAGVYSDPALKDVTHTLLQDIDNELSDLGYHDAIQQLADAFMRLSGQIKIKRRTNNTKAVQQAKDYIHNHLSHEVSMDDLESFTQHDRWQLARDFREVTATSPYRYLIYQRIKQASQHLLHGHKVADTACEFGFSDQSHFHRHFKQILGLTPKQWCTMNQAN